MIIHTKLWNWNAAHRELKLSLKATSVIQYQFFFPPESKNNYVRTIVLNVDCVLGTAQEWKRDVICMKAKLT